MHFKALLGILAVIACLGVVQFFRDYHMRIFSGPEGFFRRAEFSLLDSLPALSPGLGELEAFKLTADPSSETNADRSVWLDDSLGRVSMEFYSGKAAFDSATLYLWTSDSTLESRTLRDKRSILWDIPYGRRVRNWTEVVGFYVSRPRILNFRSAEPSIRVFEQIEGKTIHVVNRRYRDRTEPILAPDTSYSGDAGELQLLARGNALAIINPAPQPIVIRIIRLNEKRWVVCRVEGKTIQVYRHLFANLKSPILAYTSPGRTHNILVKRVEPPPLYFWLDQPSMN
jgi:hypothetical protein